MVTTKLNLSMTEPSVRQIYAKQGDTGRVLDISLDQTPEDGTLRILRPDGVEVTSEAVTGGEVESGSTFESLTEADVTELTVSIEPIQDLNGYDKPWVGGAGKNLFNIDRTEGTLSGREPSNARSFDFGKYYVGLSANNYYSAAAVNSYSLVNNGVKVNAANRPYGIAFPMAVTVGTNYYVGYTQAPNQEYRVGFFDADGNYLSASGARTQPSYFTPPASTATAVIVFTCTLSGENTDVTYANIQVEIGTNGSTWQPYSNICPITGHDEVRVTRTGKNLFRLVEAEAIKSGYDYYIPNPIPAAGSYKLTCQNTFGGSSSLGCAVVFRDSVGGTNIGAYYAGYSFGDTYREGVTTTITEEQANAQYIVFLARSSGLTFSGLSDAEIQIEPGSTAHAYEPYQGSTYTTSLGQTVYGGTLDMVTGLLTVDRVSMTFNGTQTIGLANWRPLTNSVGWLYSVAETPNILREEIKTSNISTTKLKSDTLRVAVYAGDSGIYGGDFPCISIVGGNNWGIVMRVNDTSLTTNNAINAYLENHPIQVVYPLATPTEVDLTPTQISTLLGENNVWASSGDIVSVKFAYGGLLSELPSDATSVVGKCYCDVEQNGVSSMPFTLNVKKNERES